jgi:hypothetical protein
MKNKLYLLLCAFTITVLNLFPLYQLIHTRGYLYYSNAYDETTYLQYAYSVETQGITRISQYLVTAAHEAGLSAGWINLVLDVGCLIAFLFLSRKIFQLIGFGGEESNTASFFLLVLPFLANGANPIVDGIFNYSLRSGAVRWLTVPEAHFSPLVRSPEPQLSIVFLCLAVYLALRYHTYWFVLLCLPFLYPFVAGPAAFILISIFAKEKFFGTKNDGLAWLLGFLTTCALAFAPFQLLRLGFQGGPNLNSLTTTHLPLISLSFLGASLCVLLLARKRHESHTFFLKTVALSPLALANTQILTGFIADPTNLEQFMGVYCVAVTLVFLVVRKDFPKRRRAMLAVLCLFLMADSSRGYFFQNLQQQRELPLNQQTLEILRTHSNEAAINDLGVSSIAAMVFPKQAGTLFDFSNTLPNRASRTFSRYLCAKNMIFTNPGFRDKYADVFQQLDRYYRYENMDFILLSQGRVKKLEVVHDPSFVPKDCPSMSVRYLIVK